MIQATPFDLALLTVPGGGSAVNPDNVEQAYNDFAGSRNLFCGTNTRLGENPKLGCSLRIPLTENLLAQLSQTPAWSEIGRGSLLYMLKTLVLRFLRTYKLDVQGSAHRYDVVAPSDFFHLAFSPELRAAWAEAAGVCVYKCPNASYPIHAVWIVSARQDNCASITIQQQPNSTTGDLKVSLFSRRDEDWAGDTLKWRWELMVRWLLWQDRRLPFQGPAGPFGYRPPDNWKPGNSPVHVRRDGYKGYLDALGGIWQWEGGRSLEWTCGLGGHWNVQLPGKSLACWSAWLEEVYEKPVRLRKKYINIEVDGRITDKTFE